MGILKRLRTFYRISRELFSHSYDLTEAMLQQHKSNLLQQERYSDCRRLNRHEFKVFSQSGEDGILAEIFRRVGTPTKCFVEIGTGPGLETNTTFLLMQGWTGYWIEGSAKDVSRANTHFRKVVDEKRLVATQKFVTAENIESILADLKVPTEIDLLSVDIDRNTYWVWKAIHRIKPRVVVVEYNAQIPPDVDWAAEYRPKLTWNRTGYYGASLKAYERLGREMGYSLVGCSLNGVNAFFVKNDLCGDHFAQPFASENHFEPPRYYLSHLRSGYRRCFTDIADE
jgi:hypothetical protein